MTRPVHIAYIAAMVIIVLAALVITGFYGYTYYQTPLHERFYHPQYALLKPSGVIGHGIGIIGSLLILIGVFSYMARKRYRFLGRLGLLKYWLEFHIFLCTLGPVLILFHTSFKFGGLVAISFWSMVAVFLSGIIGRFIYIQIPRTIGGRELSLTEVKNMKKDVGAMVGDISTLDEQSRNLIADVTANIPESVHKFGFFTLLRFRSSRGSKQREIRKMLNRNGVERSTSRKIMKLIRSEISLNHRIARLQTMQKVFRYWHVAHLPFALVMLVIMVVHVVVTIVFGYRWIF
ncbi:MAG: hypothetical protein EOM83_12270 [Clostridia bacterium]|nr:hypothetical protein [Clostridia bacterium]